jgi:hypothetical protein
MLVQEPPAPEIPERCLQGFLIDDLFEGATNIQEAPFHPRPKVLLGLGVGWLINNHAVETQRYGLRQGRGYESKRKIDWR